MARALCSLRSVAELHPFAVHLPIGLVLIYPFLELAAAISRRREVAVVALSLLGLAVISSLVASTTGEAAYDAAVDAGYTHGLLESHEDWAEQLPWLLIGLAGLRGYLAMKTSFGPWVGAALGLGVLGFTLQVGRTGGELVYEHGVGVKPGAGPTLEAEVEPPATSTSSASSDRPRE